MRNCWVALIVLGPVLALGGCDWGRPTLLPVRGKVTFRGVAVRGGTIVFTPDAAHGNAGPLACGEIQPDGSYVLQTGDRPGSVPGWHRVTLVAVEIPVPQPPGQRFGVPRSLLPAKYRDPELSGLTCQVAPGQENTHDFALP